MLSETSKERGCLLVALENSLSISPDSSDNHVPSPEPIALARGMSWSDHFSSHHILSPVTGDGINCNKC